MAVEITNRELYDSVQTLIGQVIVVNEKLDFLCNTAGDHETRIRSLEGRRWPLPAIGIVASLLAVGMSALALLGACS